MTGEKQDNAMEWLREWTQERFAEWLFARPDIARSLLGLLRDGPGRLTGGNSVAVLTHADVCEVLQRHGDFSLAEVNLPRTPTGPFLLSMDDSPRYRADKKLLESITHPQHPEPLGRGSPSRFETEVGAYAAAVTDAVLDRVSDASSKGGFGFDFVADLCEPVAAAVVSRAMLGEQGSVGDHASRDQRHDELCLCLRRLASNVIVTDRRVAMTVEQVSAAKCTLIDRIDERLRHGSVGQPDAVDLAASLYRASKGAGRSPEEGRDEVRRNVSGVALSACATITKASAHALEELLKRPRMLERAGTEALATPNGAFPMGVEPYLLEALRFNPLFAFLRRYCVRDSVIGEARGKPLEIKAGTRVAVGLLPAMFDPAAIDDPRRFRQDRAVGDYLHFGHGLHRCYGGRIARVIMAEMFARLLRRGRIVRTAKHDAIRYDGPAAASFPIRVRW